MNNFEDFYTRDRHDPDPQNPSKITSTIKVYTDQDRILSAYWLRITPTIGEMDTDGKVTLVAAGTCVSNGDKKQVTAKDGHIQSVHFLGTLAHTKEVLPHPGFADNYFTKIDFEVDMTNAQVDQKYIKSFAMWDQNGYCQIGRRGSGAEALVCQVNGENVQVSISSGDDPRLQFPSNAFKSGQKNTVVCSGDLLGWDWGKFESSLKKDAAFTIRGLGFQGGNVYMTDVWNGRTDTSPAGGEDGTGGGGDDGHGGGKDKKKGPTGIVVGVIIAILAIGTVIGIAAYMYSKKMACFARADQGDKAIFTNDQYETLV